MHDHNYTDRFIDRPSNAHILAFWASLAENGCMSSIEKSLSGIHPPVRRLKRKKHSGCEG